MFDRLLPTADGHDAASRHLLTSSSTFSLLFLNLVASLSLFRYYVGRLLMEQMMMILALEGRLEVSFTGCPTRRNVDTRFVIFCVSCSILTAAEAETFRGLIIKSITHAAAALGERSIDLSLFFCFLSFSVQLSPQLPDRRRRRTFHSAIFGL